MEPLFKLQNGTFFLGAILTITASIWGTILDEDMSYFGVYILGFLFGAGTTTVLVQSLAITAELIGENTNTSAFVYGAMSLTGTFKLRLNLTGSVRYTDFGNIIDFRYFFT